MGNAVLTTPRAWNQYGLRPYVSGGIGLLHASRADARNLTTFSLDLLGMNAGGGAVGFLSDRIGLRFDLRYFRKIQGPVEDELDFPVSIGPIRLRQWTTSLGVVIKYDDGPASGSRASLRAHHRSRPRTSTTETIR